MKKLILLSCLLFLPLFLSANDHELGEKLVHKLWTDGQKCPERLNKYIAKNFQETVPSLQIRRNAKEEIQAFKALHITSFKIRSLKAKRQHDTLTTTYFIAITERENHVPVTSPSTIRLSVWKKCDGKWLWVAHQGGI
jgi:hypothetical protein